jgi:hypothetical protein
MSPTFAVAADTKNLDNDQSNEEYSYPNSDIQVGTPISNSETSSGKLERQDGQPANGIVPADGKSPTKLSMVFPVRLCHLLTMQDQ